MSRVGKSPVQVPAGVDVKVEAASVRAKGKLGEIVVPFTRDVTVAKEGNALVVKPANDSKRSRTMWGTVRSLLNGAVKGVSQGYAVQLEISGVGYRAAVQGKNVQLQLGFSHDVIVPIPPGLSVTVDKNVNLEIKGANKAELGQFAANLRGLKPPEPYKGKGIKYKGETILRKEGKKK
jgi:large subunit ribosomal protein L6